MMRAMDAPLAAEPMTRILLAEDDDSLRAFLARALERAGYAVTSCADGEAALEALETARFDLLLTDIVMPGVDGIEVARVAAAKDAQMRIMFITGFAAVALSAGSRAPAGAKVLAKPVHLREIVAEGRAHGGRRLIARAAPACGLGACAAIPRLPRRADA